MSGRLLRRPASALAVVFTALITCGCGLAPFPLAKNAHAQRYADHIVVRDDYRRIDNYNGGEGSCGCDLDRWYIGPVGSDPTTVFVAPGLSWESWPEVSNDKLWEWLVHGTGYAKDSGSCHVAIQRLRHTANLYLYPDIWHLSRAQTNGWNANRLDIYELSFGCERDGL
jgi:hypothetical protein